MEDTMCLNFCGSKGNNVVINDGTAFSLMAMHGHDTHVVCYSMNSKQYGMTLTKNQCNTLAANDYKEPQIICYEVHDGRDQVHESMGRAE